MPVRWAAVMRGIKMPLAVLDMSSMAEVSAVFPLVFMLMPWASTPKGRVKRSPSNAQQVKTLGWFRVLDVFIFYWV
jgi:hypothetical protein